MSIEVGVFIDFPSARSIRMPLLFSSQEDRVVLLGLGFFHYTSQRFESSIMFAVRAFSKAAAPARAVTSRVKVVAPKRAMGSGAAPKYEGFEAKVRAVMPKDEHVSDLPE